MGLSKVGISSIAKEQVWTDDGQQFNSFFAHLLLTWGLSDKTKPLLNYFFFVINKWVQLFPMRVNSTHKS
jgi:hypothetical protein